MPAIFMTGATSFTGAYIARAFVEAGYEVIASLTRSRDAYQDPLSQRRMAFSKVTRWVENAAFGSTAMSNVLEHTPVEAFVNHGANVKAYRSADFDWLRSLGEATTQAESLMKILARRPSTRFVHTGTFFEPDEGENPWGVAGSSPSVGIYGVSKAATWQALRFWAARTGLTLTKVVLPNPIGALENPERLIPSFARQWKQGQTPMLMAPSLVRDNVPAPWLAQVYARSLRDSRPLSFYRPSGYVATNEDFLKLFCQKATAFGIQQPLPWTAKLDSVSTEPQSKVNAEACPELTDVETEKKFWSTWMQDLFK